MCDQEVYHTYGDIVVNASVIQGDGILNDGPDFRQVGPRLVFMRKKTLLETYIAHKK